MAEAEETVAAAAGSAVVGWAAADLAADSEAEGSAEEETVEEAVVVGLEAAAWAVEAKAGVATAVEDSAADWVAVG